jgi:hypothetical protein
MRPLLRVGHCHAPLGRDVRMLGTREPSDAAESFERALEVAGSTRAQNLRPPRQGSLTKSTTQRVMPSVGQVRQRSAQSRTTDAIPSVCRCHHYSDRAFTASSNFMRSATNRSGSTGFGR